MALATLEFQVNTSDSSMSPTLIVGCRGECEWTSLKYQHVPGRDFWFNTPKPQELLLPLSRLCHYQGASQPARRESRAVHTADMRISEPNGTDIWVDVRIGVAKPDCSIPQRTGAHGGRRSVGNMGRDHRTPTLYLMGSCPSFLSSMAPQLLCHRFPSSHTEAQGRQTRTRVASHPRGGMEDCSPRAVCTHLLYSFSHAPSDV